MSQSHLIGFGPYVDTGVREARSGVIYAKITHKHLPMCLWRSARAIGLPEIIVKPVPHVDLLALFAQQYATEVEVHGVAVAI